MRIFCLIMLITVLSCQKEKTIYIDEVPWQNYSPERKNSVMDMIISKDCDKLNEELIFSTDESSTREGMTGENNDKLIHFLKLKMKECGCASRQQ